MSQRPRILILSTTYLPFIGGSELAIRHITDQLSQYDFDMVTGRHSPEMPLVEDIGRIRVFRAGGRLARLTFFLPKNLMPLALAITAWRLARTHRYVAIHAYQASQAAGAAWILKQLRPDIPLILTLQEGKDLDRQPMLLRLFRTIIFRGADHITAISTYLASYARRYTKVPVDIIPNGVDEEQFVALHKTGTGEEKMIISVSRLVTKNGIANLIRAFRYVQQRIHARLVLVGGGSLHASLMQLAVDQEVAGKVDFIGSVPHQELGRYLGQADVFVRPSLSEGLGTAFLEAMAAGVPVVASSVGGIVDFLEHEKTGLVCNPHDPQDIADQIVRMLTDDRLRQDIIGRSLRMVHERYTWPVIAGQMGRVYDAFARS